MRSYLGSYHLFTNTVAKHTNTVEMPPPTPSFIQGQLRESANIEISVEEIQSILDKGNNY